MTPNEQIYLDILKTIKRGFREPKVKDVWETGWQEVLDRVRETGVSYSSLKPQYFKKDTVCRHNGEYDSAENYEAMDLAIRQSVFRSYLKDSKKIIEIGCGTGTNQLMLAEMFPEAELIAADWAKPSQGIAEEIAKHVWRERHPEMVEIVGVTPQVADWSIIRPVNFNMFTLEGWDWLGVDENSAVLTVHALEQLGGDWGLLLTALRKAKPLCVHIEPLVELYDESVMFDYMAAEYHRARGYLEGWLPAVQHLAAEGQAEIIHLERHRFGNRYHEAYSVLVWKPC